MLGQIPLVFITKKLEDDSKLWRDCGELSLVCIMPSH